jgi:putative transposase
MAGKRDKPEEIVAKLRQVEVLQGQGMSVAEAVRQIGVTQQTYYRWRRLYGGMGREQLKRLKELEKENQRLRRAVSDLTLDKLILTEARGETTEPFAPPSMHRPRAAGHRRLGTPRLPHAGPASLHPAPGPARPSGRGSPHRGHHRAGEGPRPLDGTCLRRETHDHRPAEQRRLACEPQAGGALGRQANACVRREAHPAARRAEGPEQAAEEGLRLWLNDGSCIRLRPERPNHVSLAAMPARLPGGGSCDFVQDRTHDGRVFRTLDIIDEFAKEALMIRVDRKLNSVDVVDALADLFILRGPPGLRPLRQRPRIRRREGQDLDLGRLGAKTAFIEPGSPWENGYVRASTPASATSCWIGEIFFSSARPRSSSSGGAVHYNTVRPHSALGYRPPAPGGHRPVDREARHALTIRTGPLGGGSPAATSRSTGTLKRRSTAELEPRPPLRRLPCWFLAAAVQGNQVQASAP